MIVAVSPCSRRQSNADPALSGETIIIIPIPQLNVRAISLGESRLAFAIHLKTGGTSQDLEKKLAPSSLGRIRGTFSMMPPPVMCARAFTSPNLMVERQLFTYIRVGVRSDSPSDCFSSNGDVPLNSSPASSIIFLTSEKPFE